MKIDRNKLTKEETEKIDEIIHASNKRPRKQAYTLKWVYDYLDESFKNFSYEDFDEVLDMIDSYFELGVLAKVPIFRLKSDIKYHFIEEGFNEMVDTENVLEDTQIRRLRKLLIKWGLKEKDIFPQEEEEEKEDDK